MSTTVWQRGEAVFLAALAAVVFVAAGHAWWWLPALFLVYDLSALGYVRGPRLGATVYNAVHSWALPALLVLAAVLLRTAGTASAPLEIIAGTWAFHVAVDRALGYGLKERDSFQSTHLGRIGRPG